MRTSTTGGQRPLEGTIRNDWLEQNRTEVRTLVSPSS